MTYAPHRSAPANHRAPARRAKPHEGGADVHSLRARLWIAGGVTVSAALIAFGTWAVVTTPATVLVTVADPGGSTAGDFSFDVTGLRCGVESIGPAGMAEKAAGQFCLVDLSVTNNSGEPKRFDSGAQRVRDINGSAYAVADQAAVFLNEGGSSLLDEVGPGETVTGVLPFDVPAGAHLREAALTAAMSAPGVRVRLPDPR